MLAVRDAAVADAEPRRRSATPHLDELRDWLPTMRYGTGLNQPTATKHPLPLTTA